MGRARAPPDPGRPAGPSGAGAPHRARRRDRGGDARRDVLPARRVRRPRGSTSCATNAPDAVVDGPPATLGRIAALPAVAQADAIRPLVDVPAADRRDGDPDDRRRAAAPARRSTARWSRRAAAGAARRADARRAAPATRGRATTSSSAGRRCASSGSPPLGRFTGGAWADGGAGARARAGRRHHARVAPAAAARPRRAAAASRGAEGSCASAARASGARTSPRAPSGGSR